MKLFPVVADASPLISAALAGRLYLVRGVYNKLILPHAVYQEIAIQGKGKPGASEIKQAKDQWIQVAKVQNQKAVKKIQFKFGAGESEAIILAEELKTILLADESMVIQEARRRGIPITSTIFMLLEAKKLKLILAVKIELDKFILAGFRLNSDLYHYALKLAGEV